MKKVERVIIKCKTCNKEVQKRRDKVGKYCSHECYWAGKKNSIPWNKGISGIVKASDETKRKMSVSGLGRVRPKSVGENISKAKIGKPRLDMRGSNHRNWIKDRTKALEKMRVRSSFEWRQWRRSVFERDDYTCKECGKRGCYIESHHIIPVRKNESLLFTIKNGITLCRPCHKKTMGKEHLFEEKYSSMIA